MDNKWICLDCRYVGQVDVHGRCSKCNSSAVAFAEVAKPFIIRKQYAAPVVEQIRPRLFRKINTRKGIR